jgi:hypothetical protein
MVPAVDDGGSMEDVVDDAKGEGDSMGGNEDDEDIQEGTPLQGSTIGDVDPQSSTPISTHRARARCSDLDYIHFLIAAQKAFTCTEAARCQPKKPLSPAHDAFTRLLKRQPPDTGALWREAQTVVNREKGFMVLDDTTLDKLYAEKMRLFSTQYTR